MKELTSTAVREELPATVYIVDDDVWIRRALERLVGALGYAVSAFGSALEFLEDHDPELPGCIILDVAMPGLNGLQLQHVLNRSGCQRPVIFLTGCGSIGMSVHAMKSGATSFLTKPIAPEELVVTVREAVRVDQASRADRARCHAVQERIASLTPREREVFDQLLTGLLNKQIAAVLGTTQRTVKAHRARVMSKMAVRSLAELVWLAASCQLIEPQRLRSLPQSSRQTRT